MTRSKPRTQTTAKTQQRIGSLDPGDAAWLAVLPTAAIVLVAIVVLGPPLGNVLYPEAPFQFWFSVSEASVRPESTEQARFLLVLSAPILLTALTCLMVRRANRAALSILSDLVPLIQAAAVACVAICLGIQWSQTFGDYYGAATEPPHVVYFTAATLVVAAAIAAALAAGVRSAATRARFTSWTAESPARRIAATLVAIAFTALWLLPAIQLEGTVGVAHIGVAYHMQFTFDETFAVLNGRSPLVDFAAQYGSLWPYLVAGGMAVLGTSLPVFTLLMATISGVSLLALLDVLRRLTRSTVCALLLFGPLLATSLFMMQGPLENRYAMSNYFATFPLRYAGPFLLVWLTARHLDGARPRRTWPLFLLAGLVLLNNGDFGIAALGATIAAVLWTQGRPTRTSLRRLALELLLGLAIAFALFAALTLARTGSLPDLSLLFRYARMFAVGGFGMLPMPALGFHTVIYATFVAAIGVASVRAMRGDADRLLTGLLVWSGIFGLGASSYFVGRSHPEVLTNLFAAWAFALTLLTLVALRSFAARPSLRPTLPELACLFGFGVLVCSLAQTPRPWSEFDRLQTTTRHFFERPDGQGFLAQRTERGERVLVLMQLGHRMADSAGAQNVSPYTGSQSILTQEQLDDAIAALREAGGHKVFLSIADTAPELQDALAVAGFRERAEDGDIQMWVGGNKG